jgi:hypothetical protein
MEREAQQRPMSLLSNQRQANRTTTDNEIYFQTNLNTTIGDSMTKIQDKKTLRFYHQNIRGAKVYASWNRWRDGIEWMVTQKVALASLPETNTTWSFKNKEDATRQAKKVSTNLLLSAISSDEKRLTDYQPGGAACVVLDRWTGFITEKILDASGLGRWAGFKLNSGNNKTLIIIRAYRPTPSTDKSDYTCHSQQWRLLRQKTGTDPKPRLLFVTDLITKIKEWEKNKYEIVIGMDLNESSTTKNSKLKTILNSTTLLPLVDIENAPSTYSRGTKCIDYILGTPLVKQHTTSQGYLPFYEGAWDSDHRGMYVDIDINNILQQATTLTPVEQRNLKSTKLKNLWTNSPRAIN